MSVVAFTTPYSWPYIGGICVDGLALVVCGSGVEWSQRTPLDRRAEANITDLRTAAAAHSVPVFLLRHARPSARPVTSRPIGRSRLLVASATETTIEAAGIDGFYGSALDANLRQRGCSQLLFAGHGLETTVHSTLRRANDRGYECLTISDACSAIDPACRHSALSSIEMAGGIFGAVGSTATVLWAIANPGIPGRYETLSPRVEGDVL